MFWRGLHHHSQAESIGSHAAKQVYPETTERKPTYRIQNRFRVYLPVRLFQAYKFLRNEEEVLRDSQHQEVEGGYQQ